MAASATAATCRPGCIAPTCFATFSAAPPRGAPADVHGAWRRSAGDGRGVIVFLRDGAAGVPVAALPQDGDRGSEAARQRQWREIGRGAQILKDLGITSIRLLPSAEHHYVGLAGFGIEIVASEPAG